jgi:hypothetical protein
MTHNPMRPNIQVVQHSEHLAANTSLPQPCKQAIQPHSRKCFVCVNKKQKRVLLLSFSATHDLMQQELVICTAPCWPKAVLSFMKAGMGGSLLGVEAPGDEGLPLLTLQLLHGGLALLLLGR